jgi:hypothetical protein
VIRTLYGQGYRSVAAVVDAGPEPFPAEASQVPGLSLPAPVMVPSTARVSEHKLITMLCCRWTLPELVASHLDLDGLYEMQQAAESCLRYALTLARRQHARAWELRTALILSRL